MDKLTIITQSVQKEIEAFNRLFTVSLHGHNDDFQSIIDFVSGRNGKRIRPIVVILSAKLCGKTHSKTIDYALILELLHTATLIHDDVVDNTMERRAQPSVNAQYDNRVAVLLGDYILSLAIARAVMAQNGTVMEIISRLAQNLADGELTQLIASKEAIVDEKRYFDVIRKKTAILLSSCSEMGALSANANPETREKLRLIGENLGLCFQIKDDIFDYFDQGEIGKPTGNDIREGKITLPLIHALQIAPQTISAGMLEIISQQNFSRENIQKLIEFAKKFDGIEYAQSKMQEIKVKTLELLTDFPDSEAKTAMTNLIDYIIERKK
ncbi:octaprenyl-diphosphate synthase [Bacteroidia bacterium]|nr:octaprenyl-diphosphate synthase [Bacteroidia bacterium]GHT60565.1 octaprenyl-diphosphate synthase [Bacteroidia bacterium]